MKRILFILLLTIPFIGCNEKQGDNDKPNNKQNKNDSIYKVIPYLEVDTTYYQNGKIKSIGTLVDGEKEGLWKYYHVTGMLILEINWEDDKLDGISRNYFNNGKLSKEDNFKNGILISSKDWDVDGRLISQSYLDEDGKIIDCKSYEKNQDTSNYYKTGQLESEGNYKSYGNNSNCPKGGKDGIWKHYYKTGKLESEGNYIDDKKDGLWKHYYESGQLKETVNWKDGKPNGLVKSYYESGKLKHEGNWKEGKFNNWEQEGLWKFYYENGQLKMERIWDLYPMWTEKCWDEKGNEIECE